MYTSSTQFGKNLMMVLLSCLILSSKPISMTDQVPSGKKATLKIHSTPDFDLTGDHNSINWSSFDWVPVIQRTGLEYQKQTKVKLAYSDKGIYGLFYCEDDVLTTTLKEDFTDLYNEDVVEIFFWTDEKQAIYFEYELSPTNFELPILVPNNKGNIFGWLPWHYEGERRTRHETKIHRQGEKITGWSAEFFIPYALLKPLNNVPPVKGTKWRVNMYRLDYDHGQTRWTWQPIEKNFHDYKHYGTLLFD